MFNATGERFPKLVVWLVRYGLLALMILTFTVSAIAEFENPLELPGWALFFGWALMLAPILFVVVGFCVPKRRLLCCLESCAARSMGTNIEYTSDAAAEKQQDCVMDGELELQADIEKRAAAKIVQAAGKGSLNFQEAANAGQAARAGEKP